MWHRMHITYRNLIHEDLAPFHPNSFCLRDRAILVPKSHVLPWLKAWSSISA
jgi:hypothetical protein